MSYEVEKDLLGQTLLGQDLNDDERLALAKMMSARRFADGELLARESDPQRTLFALVDGQINVAATVQGGRLETVYTMRPGECAGTGAFVEGIERLASLISHGESTVLCLEPDAFESLVDDHPRLVYKVMRSLFRARHDNLVQLYQENEQLTNYITKVHGRY